MRVSGKGYVLTAVVIMISLLLIHFVQAATGEPGTDADPAVSQSYVDSKYNDLLARINSLTTTVNDLTVKNNNLTAQLSNLGQQTGGTAVKEMKFELLELKAGQQLIAGSSTEIILRGGKAKAIGNKDDGLADITAGSYYDLLTGAEVPPNHLMLVSRDDGRGITISSEKAWIMVRGTYNIK